MKPIMAVWGGAMAENRDRGVVAPNVGDELTKVRQDRGAVPLTSFF